MDPGPVKIFTDNNVPRLRYIAGIILSDIMGLRWELVTDKRKLGRNPVINYSEKKVENAFNIYPSGLLFEQDTREITLSVSYWKSLPVFFQAPPGYDLPFDIFAASFYMISRYEEYLPFEPDEHGRFRGKDSFACRNGFLMKPVVDLWAREWEECLIRKFHNLAFKRNDFHSLVTFDIDQPFKFLGKDIIRSLGGLFLDLGKKTGEAAERYRIYTKGEKDPWDVFDYLTDKVKESGVPARFFVPVGDRTEFDVQPSWHNDDYRSLIIRIMDEFPIGLHPSYLASIQQSRTLSEASRLKDISGSGVVSSRFHFLRLSMPQSYRNLIAAGISEDYSLGFADEPGFRAGIARPFSFYDLLSEEETDLKIIPFQSMDVTLSRYRNMDHDMAFDTIKKLVDEVREVGGFFVSIWHNTTLLEDEEGMKWRQVFEKMLEIQSS